MQTSVAMEIGALETTGLAPTLIVKESVGGAIDCAIACEGQILCACQGSRLH